MEQFEKEVQKIISLCESLAFSFSHSLISSEHLLCATIKNSDLFISKELAKYKIDYDFLCKRLKNKYSRKEKTPLYMEYSLELKILLQYAEENAKRNNRDLVNLNDLILAFIKETTSSAYNLLKEKNVNIALIEKNISNSKNTNHELDNIQDLHLLGENNKDPLIGRQNELKQLINSLSRRNKPNAILIGPPGVGKTAIVEELAKKLLNEEIPSLKGKRIYELDIASSVGGTKYRGEFEEKIKKILKKVIDTRNVILFVDEIHNIIKAGGAEGAIDASNILKPYLSRGDIQMIGCTTEDEFDNIFAKDKPLKRRFQIIKVDESSKDETINILKNVKSLYEDYYHTRIDDTNLYEVVEMSANYILEQSFPDKALDLLDNTLSSFNGIINKENIKETLKLYYKIDEFQEEKLDNVFLKINENVFGQDKALKTIYNDLKSVSLKRIDNTPLLSLFLYGPSGVGKSLVSNYLKDGLYNDNNSYYLNLSSFQDAYGLNRLLSSSSYYGESDNKFVSTFKKHPHSLLILDEIESANNEMLEFINQILDKGGFYDNKGKFISMSNSLIIMLSNYGFTDDSLFHKNVDEIISKDKMMKKLNLRFKTSFLAKIDDIIFFSYLNKESGKKILHNKFSFEFSEDMDFDDYEFRLYGARYLKKKIKQNI